MKTVKSISTKRFELNLTQLSNGVYVVAYEVLGITMVSGEFADYKAADRYFEATNEQLEGN